MTSRPMTALASISISALSWSRIRDRVFATGTDSAGPILRLGLAAVMWPHGAQKLLGWFGGYGFEGTLGFLTGTVGVPAPLAVLTILGEFFGPILLVLGLGTRFVAASFAAIMVAAVTTVHLPNGFFMSWSGTQAGEGYEYHLLVIAMSLALLARGAGRLSLDRLVARGGSR